MAKILGLLDIIGIYRGKEGYIILGQIILGVIGLAFFLAIKLPDNLIKENKRR